MALNNKDPRSTAIYARHSQDPVLEAVNFAAELMGDNLLPDIKANTLSIASKSNGPIKFHLLAAQHKSSS